MEKKKIIEYKKQPKVTIELFNSIIKAKQRYNELVEQGLPVYFYENNNTYVVSLEQ